MGQFNKTLMAFIKTITITITITITMAAHNYKKLAKKTCLICTDMKAPGDMFRSAACSHSHSFCTTCIAHHIKAKLEHNNIANVKCPEPGCDAPLDPTACASFLPKETMERWGDALCESAILGVQKLFCPFVDCSVTMIEDGGEEVREAECMSCRRMFCAQCKVGWHGDMSCEEFQTRSRGEKEKEKEELMVMNELAEKEKWKRCPHCQTYVSRISGCEWIKCRCGSQFCYGCGAKWGGNHACPDSAYARRYHH